MATPHDRCPDCDTDSPLDRRRFLQTAGLTAASLWAVPRITAAPTPSSPAETAVKALYDSFTESQRAGVCFPWDHQDSKRGLLRTHVSNNWQITPHVVKSDFFTRDQQTIIHDIHRGLINPAWYDRFMQQTKDDNGGKPWGTNHAVALFGKPGEAHFEFVMTGRHMTLRADGHTEDHVAFGGPIFYGHAAQGFNEKADHAGNVFWPQALSANRIYTMLDGKHRKLAIVEERPHEADVGFRGPKGGFPGVPVKELAGDQKEELGKVLAQLIEPFRSEDRDEALACLKRQGGLDQCSLAFYKDGDIGEDGVWDNWRLEGPSFVWYFRGEPHVHVWVNVADDPSVKLNAKG